MWCNNVCGENVCHQSTATDRALLITSLVPPNSAFDGCEAGRAIPDGPRGTEHCPAQLSASAKTRSKNRERESVKKHKKPKQRGANIAATRWQNPLEVAAAAAARLCSGCSLFFLFPPRINSDKLDLPMYSREWFNKHTE